MQEGAEKGQPCVRLLSDHGRPEALLGLGLRFVRQVGLLVRVPPLDAEVAEHRCRLRELHLRPQRTKVEHLTRVAAAAADAAASQYPTNESLSWELSFEVFEQNKTKAEKCDLIKKCF